MELLATRNTCFALISALESDLRTAIQTEAQALGIERVLPDDSRGRASERWVLANKSNTQDPPSSDFDLLDFTDFGEISKILSFAFKPIPPTLAPLASEVGGYVNRLTPVRNRVCHSRPLEFEDLPTCIDIANLLAVKHPTFLAGTIKTLERLKANPEFALAIQVPHFWTDHRQKVHHNLPLPEFDETGFLGRTEDRRNLMALLDSHYPVVTVVGEGGAGKTALALRCLYDLVDREQSPYDAIVWVSLKTSVLTAAGVGEVANSIATTVGLMTNITLQLGGSAAVKPDLAGLFQEVVDYLREYRILIAIDNLETLPIDTLRPLLIAVPNTSKILFTSRIGLGEFEARYALPSLDLGTAIALLRRFARVLGVDLLYKAPEERLKKFAETLFGNPLLIKWFVATVAKGAEPQSLLNGDTASFEAALGFCFSNLFERMSSGEKGVLLLLSCARRPLTPAEIYFLTENIDQYVIEQALALLNNSSVVRRVYDAAGEVTRFALTDAAAAYLAKRHPPSREVFNHIRGKLRSMESLISDELAVQESYRYEIFSLHAHTPDQKISAHFLRRALDLVQRNKAEDALPLIQEAKRITPNYSEVWRVAGIQASYVGDIFRATEEYEQAIACNQESAIVRYTFAQFLIRYLQDYLGALVQLEKTLRIDSSHPAPRSAYALVLMRLGRFAESAVAYEQVIGQVKDHPKRWRISTLDQAAECYRRWAEQCERDRDEEAAYEHYRRAIEIVDEAITSRSFDRDTQARAGEIIDSVLRYVGKTASWQFGVDALQSARRWVEDAFSSKLTLPHEGYILDATLPSREVQELLDIVADGSGRNRREVREWIADHPDIVLGDKRVGVVSRIASERFGFLVDSDTRTWFFHRTNVKPTTEWRALKEGTPVTFTVGRNERGVCAIDVGIIVGSSGS
jgi:LuxR family glucitol operon transcriptional activator